MTHQDHSLSKEEYTKLTNIALDLFKAIYDIIAAAGPEGLPSGHLYTQVCDRITLNLYLTIISTLKDQGFIEENNHILKTRDWR